MATNTQKICGTCTCGNQTWIIFINRVVCPECHNTIVTAADLDFNSLVSVINEDTDRIAKRKLEKEKGAMSGKNKNLNSTIVMTLKPKTLHIISQDGQPIGSRNKSCDECGLHVEKCDKYTQYESNYTEKKAKKLGLIRCIEK